VRGSKRIGNGVSVSATNCSSSTETFTFVLSLGLGLKNVMTRPNIVRQGSVMNSPRAMRPWSIASQKECERTKRFE
jgi:hypothetical protein